MATSFEELRVLRKAEAVADGIWFAGSLKAQRHSNSANQKAVREISAAYIAGAIDDTPDYLFTEAELEWLQATKISNL